MASLQSSDVDQAIKVATEAFEKAPWARLPANERGVHLHRLADAIEARKDVIAQIESLDCGKIFAQAQDDVQNL